MGNLITSKSQQLLSRFLRKNTKSMKFLSLILQVIVKLLRIVISKQKFLEIFKFMESNSLETLSLPLSTTLPDIEILIPVAPKDLDMLEIVIKCALDSSENRIRLVTIVVPDDSLHTFEAEIQSWNIDLLKVIPESVFIPFDLLSSIRDIFGNRSGWVIAEFLKLAFVCTSNSDGVLVIDADTILFKKKVWLDSSGVQALMPVVEFHPEYFEFLERCGVKFSNAKSSFMSHHMLLQPVIYKEFFEILAKSSLYELLELIRRNRSEDSLSPFCLCYEAYSHYLVEHFEAKFRLEKWSNLRIKRSKLLNGSISIHNLRKKYRKYSSVSAHSYIQ